MIKRDGRKRLVLVGLGMMATGLLGALGQKKGRFFAGHSCVRHEPRQQRQEDALEGGEGREGCAQKLKKELDELLELLEWGDERIVIEAACLQLRRDVLLKDDREVDLVHFHLGELVDRLCDLMQRPCGGLLADCVCSQTQRQLAEEVLPLILRHYHWAQVIYMPRRTGELNRWERVNLILTGSF